MKLEGKTVLVFGTGKSGIGAANLLRQIGAEVILYNSSETVDQEKIFSELTNRDLVELLLGELKEEVLDKLDLTVISPGVPIDLAELDRMRARNIPIWGEVELAYACAKGTLLAITGTNGKTTTTALLGKIITDYYKDAYIVGNIGTPYTEDALKTKESSFTVAEISSFQLESIVDFHPKVSAILNITPDHLNRHHTMECYIETKEKIAMNQGPEDTIVLNYEDQVLRAFGEQLRKEEKVQVLFFSSGHILEQGIFLEDGSIYLVENGERTKVVDTDELQIIGIHNYENTMAAVGMAIRGGVPLESIRESVRTFHAVEHRIEYVAEKRGIRFYNDSKGTNPDAAIKGIQAMNRPTLLIGGGYDKESQYEEWIRSFQGKVKHLVLIGQTKEKIAEAAKRCGFMETSFADTLEEAIDVCVEKAQSGDAVLLSPACASWGMFDNYEQRGDVFKAYIKNLWE